MHKKIALLVITYLFLQFKLMYAQQKYTIVCKLLNQNVAVEFVKTNLYLFKDSNVMLTSNISNNYGIIVFKNIIPNDYIIQINSIGFKIFKQKIGKKEFNQDTIFKEIKLIENTNNLEIVGVNSSKKMIEKTPNGFMINASANLTQLGGTVTELLKNTPTIDVDAEGNITLRGKAPLILINGRNSTISNMDQIVASNIETIEIITSPSAKYDASAESGIINIILKKNKQDGINGAASITAGLGDKLRESTSFILNKKSTNWNLGLSYNNRFAGRTRNSNAGRTNFFNIDEYQLIQNRDDSRLEQLQNVKFNVDFTPNKLNLFSLEIIGNKTGQDNDESLFTLLKNNSNQFLSSNNRHSLEYVRENEIEIAFDYQRKFINKQNFLNISITNSSNFDKENTDITTQSLDALLNNINNTLIQKTHNYEDGSITTTKIDYGFPLITNTHFEMGYKAIYRLVNTDFLNATKMGNDYIPNPISTNNFNFKEQIQAGYLNLNSYFGEKENPVFSYEIGGRTEYIKNNGENKSVSKTFTNEYIKFFPNIRFLHYFNVNSYIKLSYEKRINRPNFGQLNPFVDITDSLNPHSGNPNLKPEIIDNFELSFNKDWDKINFITNIYFRYATDAIRAYIFLQNNGVALIMPINIGNSTTIGLEQILRHKVNSTFDYTISNALYNQTIDATNQTNGQTQHAIAWNIKSINNIQISQKGKLQVVGSYSSATPSTQGSRNAQYYIDLGYQLKIGKTGNSRLGLTIIDLFNTLETGYQNNTALFTNFRNVKTDTRALMITFAHTFKTIFKEKLLENQFSKEY